MNNKKGILIEVTQNMKPVDTPSNRDIERRVVSIMLNNEDILALACDSLSSAEFFDTQYEIIFTAIKDMFIENIESVSFFTVVERLKKMGMLDMAGGAENVSNLSLEGFSSAGLMENIKVLKKYSLNRAIISNAKQTLELCYNNKTEPDLIACHSVSKLEELNLKHTESELTSVADIVSDVCQEIKDDVACGDKKEKGLSSGFRKMDKIIGGLQKTDLIILGGRSGDGKTSLAVNIAQHVSKEYPVLYFIIEMRANKVVKRMLSAASELDFNNIKTRGCFSEDEHDKFDKAEEDLQRSKLYYYDRGELPLERLKSVAMRAKREKGIELIVVDYLQQLDANTKNNESREREVAKISRGLKALAMSLDVPVMALVQINEDDKSGDAPGMNSVRESRAIIHDADIVMYLYNRHTDKVMCAYNGDDTDVNNRNIRELVIRKNRNGVANKTLLLHWRPTITKYSQSSLDMPDYRKLAK